MMIKFLSAMILTSTLLSLRAEATTYFKCTGTTDKETLQFLLTEERTVAIYQVSSELCAGYFSIADDAVFLETVVPKPYDKTDYSTWYENWGFGLTLSNALLKTMVSRSKTFSVDYKFKYSDIAEAEVNKKLSCSVLSD
ncbi:MAG: hypothetical protein H7Z71_06400 [Moraxellaceae bacterium]|nr:hypothetical protein [Pseudobdellovibrionaceae bacterium]